MGGRNTIWRKLGSIAAAYLLVAQAVLVGFAHQASAAPSNAPFDLVICLNGGEQPGSPGGASHKNAMACCGIGCLMAAHLLPSPTAPDQALTYPSAEIRVVASATAKARVLDVGDGARRPRGPPASA